MMMIINYFSEDTLNSLRSNLTEIKSNIDFKGEPNLQKVLDNDNLLLKSNIEVEDFKLVSNTKKKTDSDLDNIKLLYTKFKFFTESKASDERLWASLSLNEFYDYMAWRWPVEHVNDIKNRYFFGYSKQRSLVRHGLARLWWIGHLTYDVTRDNPFELTEFITENSDYIGTMLERNFSNNKIIIKAMIDALVQSREKKIIIDRPMVREVSEYLIKLSGVYLIDLLDYDEITRKIKSKISGIEKNRTNNEKIN